MCKLPFVLTFALLLSGCANPPSAPPRSADHPASPAASEAAASPPSAALAATSDMNSNAPAQKSAEHSDMNRMGEMKDMGDMKGMKMEPPSHAPSAATTQASASYTCTMHPQIVRDKPGACPICGMKLVLKKTDTRGQQ